MAYLGCILFGLIFVVMTAQSNGSLAARMEHTVSWIHSWAPFSYLIILILVVSPFMMIKIMNTWPKREEPEDVMARYRRESAKAEVLED